jgi:hypothetical protein
MITGQELNDRLTQLAGLNFVEYEAQRKKAARELGVRVGALDKQVDKYRSEVRLQKMPKEVMERIREKKGRIVYLTAGGADPAVVESGKAKPWFIRPGDTEFDSVMLDATGKTQSQPSMQPVIDRIRIMAHSEAKDVQHAYYSFAEEVDGKRTIYVMDYVDPKKKVGRLLIVNSEGVQEATEEEAKTLFISPDPDAKPWTYSELSPEQIKEAAGELLWIANSLACPKEQRLSALLAQIALPFFRQLLDTRPILHANGKKGSGKSYGMDKGSYVLYGHSALERSSVAALNRQVLPYVVHDDKERLTEEFIEHLRTSSTGARRRTVNRQFGVDSSGNLDTINVLTSINVPKDSALIDRFWVFQFSSKNWDNKKDYKLNFKVVQRILKKRDLVLSFLLEAISKALHSIEKDGWPTLHDFGEIPKERTSAAQGLLLALLKAIDQLAPHLIEPEKEFRGFLDGQRHEEKTVGNSNVMLTALEELVIHDEYGCTRDCKVCNSESQANCCKHFVGSRCPFRGVSTFEGRLAMMPTMWLNAMRETKAKIPTDTETNMRKFFESLQQDSSCKFDVVEVTGGKGAGTRKGWAVSQKPPVEKASTE